MLKCGGKPFEQYTAPFPFDHDLNELNRIKGMYFIAEYCRVIDIACKWRNEREHAPWLERMCNVHTVRMVAFTERTSAHPPCDAYVIPLRTSEELPWVASLLTKPLPIREAGHVSVVLDRCIMLESLSIPLTFHLKRDFVILIQPFARTSYPKTLNEHIARLEGGLNRLVTSMANAIYYAWPIELEDRRSYTFVDIDRWFHSEVKVEDVRERSPPAPHARPAHTHPCSPYASTPVHDQHSRRHQLHLVLRLCRSCGSRTSDTRG